MLASHADKLTEDGRQRLVRHGHLPEREVMTGIGPVAVRCPRVRDRVGEGSERIRFPSAILPHFGVCYEWLSMDNARASWRERPPISGALLQSSSERGVRQRVGDGDCLAGHIGFELPNPRASYLFELP